MGFWDKVSGELKKAAQEGWGVVKEGAKVAAEKSEVVAKKGKLKYNTYNKHKEAEKLFVNLGGLVYDMAKPPYENPLSNAEVMKVIEEIKKVEEETANMEDEMKQAGHKEESSEAETTEEPEETKKPSE